MKVLLNATDGPLSLRAIRRYVLEMTAGLGHPDSGVDLRLVFFTHRVMRIRQFLQQLPSETRYQLRVVPVPRRILYQRYAQSRWELRSLTSGVDLYHEPTTDNPCLKDVPTLTTVHGLCPLIRPDILDPDFVTEKSAWFDRCIQMSQYFTPVSETSLGEFVNHFDVDPHQVRAIPLGISEHFHPLPPEEVRAEAHGYFGLKDPYVLYVGGIQPNKNVGLVLRVFRNLIERRGFSGKLVMAGDMHYGLDEFRHWIEELGIADRVHLAGCFAPEDPRLAAIYRGASLFVFPSFYEGWTSPPLEAMACGTPVIASSASSIPETVGNGGLLADPDNDEAWTEAALRVLADPSHRSDLIDRGLQRASLFPWSRTVHRTIDFYRDILESGQTRVSQPVAALAQ